MKTTIEQRLKRLEEEVLGKKKEEREFVTIDVPGVPKFEMAVYQERDESGDRIVSMSYTNALQEISKLGCRMITIEEVIRMARYTKKKGIALDDTKGVEDLFGVSDMGLDEWVLYLESVAGIRWVDGANAGVFALALYHAPSNSDNYIGFRCCRDL